uniref:Zinc finger CCHC domain-containing protein 7 n=1 Tax=Anopheles minimus TaxID=112268 RepID=A0A182WJY2_9DIPT
MDLEEQDLAVLEERLYSSIHHSYEDAPKIPDAAPAPSPPVRIVSRTSVVNNSQGVLPANMKRYWVGSSIPNVEERAPYAKNTATSVVSKPAAPEKNASESNKNEGSAETAKMFLAPYQSLLGNMDANVSGSQPSVPEVTSQKSTVPERVTVPKNAPKLAALQLKKKKQTKQTTQYVEKKMESLLKLINKDRKQNAIHTMDSKKAKANKVRQRKRPQIVVAEITLNSSDEDSTPTVHSKSAVDHSASDEETDEVIIIPPPPPPQICIDCSDEEETQSIQFALPKSNKRTLKGHTTVNSPRCRSPSNSSIMSDDFIGQHDRSRLNDSFTENIPSDDELECSVEGRMKDVPERVPSISSEDTVCTSGDATDQEKRPKETGKGTAKPKSQPEVNAKSKKESAPTKKTPSKQKPAKTVPVEPAMSPRVSKRNANNKSNSGAISNDTANNSKTPGKSKTGGKSPVTPRLEIVRNTVEAPQGSGKKVKAKKDGLSAKVIRSMAKSITQSTVTSGTSSDKSTECLKNGNASRTGTKSKTKKILPIEDNVSSESDIDIFSKTTTSIGTPQGKDNNTSKRSASSFVEELDDVSSESDYDESFLQLKKMVLAETAEKERRKRVGRKRKQYNSETYSDEDFACLLTDIVRAVSDTEDDDDDMETTVNVNNESNAQTVATSTSSSKEVRNLKKKRKVKDVALESGSAVGEMQQPVNNNADVQQHSQTELAAKKKKKLKNPKPGVKALAGSGCNTPEIQIDPSDSTAIVHQPQDVTRKERSVTLPSSPHLEPTYLGSSDEDVQIIVSNQRPAVPSTSGESLKVIQPIGPDCAWNEEMKHFYNESWTDEGLNVDLVLRNMPYDSRNWYIVHKDRFPDPPKKHITCSNCGEQGHMRYKCRNAPKQPICFMCGEKGHKEPRCPKTVCLNCGAKARSFVRRCKSCTRDAEITCFTCGLRGHAQRSCPDLWRRYHSTIEDNVPLREQYESNPNARWCCICGKSGHQAHACTDARRMFGDSIPNVKVNSYMPAYRGEYNRCSKHRNDEQERRLATDPSARYNLFSTDANSSEFNLPEITHEGGFYYNFLKSTGLLEKYMRPVSNVLEEDAMEPQPEAIEQPVEEPQPLESTRPASAVSLAEETTKPEPPRTEQTICAIEPAIQQDRINDEANEVPVLEENSNYSFSEFHTEEMEVDDTQQNVDIKLSSSPPPPSVNSIPKEKNNLQQSMLSDFISLNTDSIATPSLPEQQALPPAQPVPATVTPDSVPVADLAVSSAQPPVVIPPKEEKVDNAKVLLTKDRATLLLSDKGTEFLNENGKKHNVQLSIVFESVGNVLLITGAPESQEKFHEELVRFLTEQEHLLKNEKYFKASAPKMTNKMTRYIALFLRGLVEDKGDVGALWTRFKNAKNVDTQEKHRRQLNVLLFGVYGLREGRKHLNILRAQLALCMKANPWKSELPQQRRSIIEDAIRYIFSAYDHKHYAIFVKEYEELKQANKLKKITYNDLGIPRIIHKPKTLQDELNKQKAAEIKKAKQKEARRLATSRKGPDGLSEDDKHYANFIRKATTYQPVGANRTNQYENLTRTIYQTPGYENRGNNGPNNINTWHSYNRVWIREEPAPRRVRIQPYRQSHAQQYDGRPSSSNVSRLADRASALRDQEYSQLQRLQDMLR